MERWCLQRHPWKLTLWTRSRERFFFRLRLSFCKTGKFLGSQDFSSSNSCIIFTVAGSRVGATFQATGLSSAAPTHIPKTCTETQRTKRQRKIPSGLSPFLAMRWQARRNVVPRNQSCCNMYVKVAKRSTDKKSFHEMLKIQRNKKGVTLKKLKDASKISKLYGIKLPTCFTDFSVDISWSIWVT